MESKYFFSYNLPTGISSLAKKNFTGIPSEERGLFYFSHSGTVQKFLAFLRLYGSDGMTSDGYSPGRDWAWRTSRLSPFGANAAFVLQQCGAGTYKVGLFVNEQLGKQRENCFF